MRIISKKNSISKKGECLCSTITLLGAEDSDSVNVEERPLNMLTYLFHNYGK